MPGVQCANPGQSSLNRISGEGMKIFIRSLALFSVLLLIGCAALAPGTSGSLVGTVTSSDAGLPGVTVTLSSPALQGTRTTVTGEGGSNKFFGLPPGDYSVQFELEGMQKVTKKTRVTLTQTSREDADLKQAAVTEAITVTASAPAALETTEVTTTFTSETIAELPTLNRTIATAALLAPGVNDGGPNNQIVISGAQSFDKDRKSTRLNSSHIPLSR